MSHFFEIKIDVSIPISGDIRTMKSSLSYYSDIAGEVIKAEEGFKTDLGSIPQFLQGIFPKDGLAMFAYIIHDKMYRLGKYSRSKSDDILDEAMKKLGVSWWRRKSVRNGLRVGGWVAWNKHRKGLPCTK